NSHKGAPRPLCTPRHSRATVLVSGESTRDPDLARPRGKRWWYHPAMDDFTRSRSSLASGMRGMRLMRRSRARLDQAKEKTLESRFRRLFLKRGNYSAAHKDINPYDEFLPRLCEPLHLRFPLRMDRPIQTAP